MKKYLAIGAATLLMTTSVAGLAYGASGWSNANGDWEYLDSDGQAVTEQWRKSSDGWYYLGEDGKMVKDGVIEVNDSRYYVDQEGRMTVNRWIAFAADDETANEYDIDNCWYYFGSDGKAFYKKGNSFKKKIDQKTYAFDENGVMLTGFLDEDGSWIDDTDDPFVEAKYYCGEDGSLYTNQWLQFDYRGGSDLESELAAEDYSRYDAFWLYFDANSKKVKSSDTDKVVQRDINEKTYGFDENGVMLPWWNEVATKSNASTSAKFYSGYDGGQLMKNTWVWMYPSESLSEQAIINKSDYQDQECSWWRTDDNGKVIKDKIRQISGKKYAFDDIGRMQTGFVLYDGNSNYVAQYDVDTYKSDSFIDGSILKIEKADLYLFGPDELNDGAMQYGSNIIVELADGTFTFGFDQKGKAFGSRNKLAKKNDRYYINGLRLDADTDLKYGVVQVSDETGNEVYKVVDTNGKIVEGSKKVVKDKEGCWYIIINNEFKAYVGEDDDKPKWYRDQNGVEGYYHYDSDNKEDRYAEGLIAGKDSTPDISELPDEARLNFD